MELEFVKWLASRSMPNPNIALGIGDDAALLNPPGTRQLVVTTDMLTDRVHFDLREHSAEQVGYKALAVNLSDLAAMAAVPMAAFVSINVPRSASNTSLPRELITGMRRATEQITCPIAGGDTNVTDGPLVVSVTAVGSVESGCAWLRSGGQPGDRLLITGQLGGSLLGWHLDFTPRVYEACQLRATCDIHAAIDISDGLALDLSRMIEASGVGAIVDIEHVPVSPDAIKLSKQSGKSPLAHALGDGEDFELLLAAPADVATLLCDAQPFDCGFTDVGELTAEGGLQQRDASGLVSPLAANGYQHGK